MGSESDGVAARRRLRAASLPTSDAGEGDREGDGDAMAGSRSPPRSSIVAPAGSSSAGVDAGVAPRGAVALRRAAQARALLDGRDYCIPEDVRDLALDVMAHRVTPDARRSPGRGSEEILHERRRVGRAARRQVVERARLVAGELDPGPEREEVAHRVDPAPSRCPVESRPTDEVPLVQSFVLVFRGVERGVDALDVVVAGSLAHPALGFTPFRASVTHGARVSSPLQMEQNTRSSEIFFCLGVF